jgi:Flp pilus assembly protein TadD
MTPEDKKISELLEFAVSEHRNGNLFEAEQAYRTIIKSCPEHAEAFHLLGIIAYQRGYLEIAIDLIDKAIKIKPNSPAFYNNLGNALQTSGQLEAAIAAYERALALNPDYPEAHNNLGNALQTSGQLEAAIAAYERALALNPDYPEAHNNLGNALQTSGQLEAAIAAYERALALQPNYPEANKNLGDILIKLTKFDESIDCYQKALAVNPQYIPAKNNLGVAFLCKDRYDLAQDVFHYLAFQKYGTPPEKMAKFDTKTADLSTALYASPFKLKDRIDQINYLLRNNLIDASFQSLVERYHLLLDELNSQIDRVPYTPLTQQQVELFAGYYDKILHYADAPRVAGSAINEALDWQYVQESYKASSVVYFDDFLSPEALEELRKFCLESTVFFRDSEAGFVGSYMSEGFVCSLIYQVIADLKRNLSDILAGLPLNNMWVYRYASRGSGVKTHTGDGSVTINFWITPDEANLNPNGGSGLVMYDKEQPLDWDWLKYNTYKDDPRVQARINEFLASANSLTIPYRCNRAVIFHSNLFHRSDPFHFHDSFENRRMNITMLFGQRGQESVALK